MGLFAKIAKALEGESAPAARRVKVKFSRLFREYLRLRNIERHALHLNPHERRLMRNARKRERALAKVAR